MANENVSREKSEIRVNEKKNTLLLRLKKRTAKQMLHITTTNDAKP